MNEKVKDILVRAGKTFIQGALAYLTIALANCDLTSTEAIRSVLIGALAGGISALMNVILAELNKRKEVK